ncbi:DNA-binding LytR/AlgR family response regulator [Filimonas zeae]|uniref:DNA-binding response regulator n=1 Tax=Filimonas zeae TaxID=1737353 RepID=A0A917MZ52_9BACT|nr:LytTR family DNA-binding domain-containing protein [Filimonas zeae]MDR6342628.1 DNA-binding LytR/AlgR family response regulator [Filimonas zeae]GGH82060.1 DNA-binding response regulator [Filimonas zeae]
MNCIIIEDEPLAQERNRDYIERIPLLKLVAVFDNALDALVYLQQNTVDLIFLDIQMDGLTGIQLLESVRINRQVIITTAYHEFALKGFELRVTDYLLKPYTFERFLQAVDKALAQSRSQEKAADKSFIFVKTGHQLKKLPLNELLYVEGRRDYRNICTTQTSLLTLQTFSELEADIPASVALRIHKSYMVALDKIDTVEKDAVHIGDRIIPVSDTYRKAFFEQIGKSL